jgi:phosphate:Na+ symporter
MRMVQSGVERAFGSDLRRVLGRALRNRLIAVVAGTGVTTLLQSSTATAMMVTSFAARGAIELIPALAVMLGANVGTALIVKALSFDMSWVSPLLLLAGYISFKRGPKGRYATSAGSVSALALCCSPCTCWSRRSSRRVRLQY